MKPHPSISNCTLTPWFWAVITILMFALGFTCFGQETNAVAPADAPAQVTGGVTEAIIALAIKYPAFASFLLILGTLRLCMKPLMAMIRMIVSSTETKADDAVLDKVERSWLFTGFLFALDWLTSIKLKPSSSSSSSSSTSSKPLDVGCWLLLAGCLVSLTACAPIDPQGVYAGDQFLQKSELTITTSYDVIHTYVIWEEANRAALAGVPEIKQSADAMRASSKQWFASANAIHDAYAANPTPDNRNALTTALAVLQTAMNEAVKYMSQAAATK